MTLLLLHVARESYVLRGDTIRASLHRPTSQAIPALGVLPDPPPTLVIWTHPHICNF